MALTRQQKKEIIDDLKDKLNRQKTMVFVDFTGLKVRDLSKLRRELKKSDSLFKVSKKNLLKIALKDFSSALVEKAEGLKGELGVIFGFEDEILPAKITHNLASKNENLKILGGFFEGKFIEKERVIELAQIPSKDELLARLVGGISAPLSNLVYILEGNLKGLVYTLSAIKK